MNLSVIEAINNIYTRFDYVGSINFTDSSTIKTNDYFIIQPTLISGRSMLGPRNLYTQKRLLRFSKTFELKFNRLKD